MDPRFRGGDEKNTGGGMITDGDASFTVRERVSGMIVVPAANQVG